MREREREKERIKVREKERENKSERERERENNRTASGASNCRSRSYPANRTCFRAAIVGGDEGAILPPCLAVSGAIDSLTFARI